MKKLLKIFAVIVSLLTISISAASAESPYPATLENGVLICVDGGMGVGRYADKDSVSVDKYAPPFYELSIDIFTVNFSEEYWKEHGNYIYSPYNISNTVRLYFRYNWDTKTIFHKQNDVWKVWDLNRHYSHADGNPLIPYAAEVAFVSAYHMKFFDDKTGYDGYRVIDKVLYDALGI